MGGRSLGGGAARAAEEEALRAPQGALLGSGRGPRGPREGTFLPPATSSPKRVTSRNGMTWLLYLMEENLAEFCPR
eukprot:6234238-Pyramimonas_sp.AAC.1